MGHSLRRALIGALLVLGVASPGHAQPLRQAGDLTPALSAMPPGAGAIAFTDWALLKQYEGMPRLTSASPDAQRLRFISSLQRDQAAFTAFGLVYFAGQARAWSWDSTDLTWEASAQSGGQSPAYVLRFRDNFNFTPLVKHFVTRGFTRSVYHGIAIYSHSMDLRASWLLTTDRAILNTAVLPAQHVLVLSASLAVVHTLLDVVRGSIRSFGSDPAVQAAATRLGIVTSAMVFSGAAACALLNPNALVTTVAGPAATATLRRELEHQLYLDALERAHRYGALAIGYRYQDKRPLGIVVLHYADPALARSDLALRRSMATIGFSVVSQQPYRTLFTLEGASVVGSDIVLQLRPVPLRRGPQLFVQMTDARDLAFAGCPGA